MVKEEFKPICRICEPLHGMIYLKPHIAHESAAKSGTKLVWIKNIDHWFCPNCGLMYHFDKDNMTLVEQGR